MDRRVWTTSIHYRNGVFLHTASSPQPDVQPWQPGWRSYAGHFGSVNGQPAQFVVRMSDKGEAAGEAVSELRWVAGNRIFTLTALEDVRGAAPAYGRDWLAGIAAAIR